MMWEGDNENSFCSAENAGSDKQFGDVLVTVLLQ